MKKLIMIVTALMLSGMMFAQEYHWTAPNSSLYDYRNHITAQVKIDGVLQASDAIEIAAFIGDEVRGVIRLLEPYPVGLPGQYYTYLTVFANQPEIGQTITLKAYDHATGTEYGNCQQTFLSLVEPKNTITVALKLACTLSSFRSKYFPLALNILGFNPQVIRAMVWPSPPRFKLTVSLWTEPRGKWVLSATTSAVATRPRLLIGQNSIWVILSI